MRFRVPDSVANIAQSSKFHGKPRIWRRLMTALGHKATCPSLRIGLARITKTWVTNRMFRIAAIDNFKVHLDATELRSFAVDRVNYRGHHAEPIAEVVRTCVQRPDASD
jgi:hypothetical protein